MTFLKLLLISLILVAVAMLALGIKLLIDRKAKFTGGSCQATAENGFSCACGSADACTVEEA